MATKPNSDCDDTALDDVGSALGLDPDKRRILTAHVKDIERTIAAHKAQLAANIGALPRKQRNSHLREITKHLSNLEDLFQELGARNDRSLSRLLSETLAKMLSNDGIEATLGRPAFWSDPSFHLLESREAQERNGPYPALERHSRTQRLSVAKGNTPTILHGLCRDIRRQVDAFLDLERERNKGGGPARIYRNFIVERLAHIHRDLFGCNPTRSPEGDFYALCEYVLYQLGEDTRGLESAVQRILSKLDL